MYNHNQKVQMNTQAPGQYKQAPKSSFFGISKLTWIFGGVLLTIGLLVLLYKTIRGNHVETMFSLKDIMSALPSRA